MNGLAEWMAHHCTLEITSAAFWLSLPREATLPKMGYLDIWLKGCTAEPSWLRLSPRVYRPLKAMCCYPHFFCVQSYEQANHQHTGVGYFVDCCLNSNRFTLRAPSNDAGKSLNYFFWFISPISSLAYFYKGYFFSNITTMEHFFPFLFSAESQLG